MPPKKSQKKKKPKKDKQKSSGVQATNLQEENIPAQETFADELDELNFYLFKAEKNVRLRSDLNLMYWANLINLISAIQFRIEIWGVIYKIYEKKLFLALISESVKSELMKGDNRTEHWNHGSGRKRTRSRCSQGYQKGNCYFKRFTSLRSHFWRRNTGKAFSTNLPYLTI